MTRHEKQSGLGALEKFATSFHADFRFGPLNIMLLLIISLGGLGAHLAVFPFDLKVVICLFGTALSLALLLMSLMLPLTLRLGAMGLIVLLVVLQVIGVILLTVVQLTGSNADLWLIAALVDGARGIRASLGATGFQLALWAGLCLLLLASYRVSVHLFERREL